MGRREEVGGGWKILVKDDDIGPVAVATNPGASIIKSVLNQGGYVRGL